LKDFPTINEKDFKKVKEKKYFLEILAERHKCFFFTLFILGENVCLNLEIK